MQLELYYVNVSKNVIIILYILVVKGCNDFMVILINDNDASKLAKIIIFMAIMLCYRKVGLS